MRLAPNAVTSVLPLLGPRGFLWDSATVRAESGSSAQFRSPQSSMQIVEASRGIVFLPFRSGSDFAFSAYVHLGAILGD
jgi:hypothetical protein